MGAIGKVADAMGFVETACIVAEKWSSQINNWTRLSPIDLIVTPGQEGKGGIVDAVGGAQKPLGSGDELYR